MSASLEHAMSGAGATAESLPAAGLPLQLTRFVGRSEELARIRDMLAGTRLLTLTGPGGSGKTRLALEIARDAASGGGPVWWVELGGLTDPTALAQEVAASLRLVEEPGRSPTQALRDAIGVAPALLVLDNCEHLVHACALLSDQLLRSCPGLTILATSREALAIAGETAWLVPPLSLPPQERVTPASLPERSEAVALFVERAQAVTPGFCVSEANADAVAGICRTLDGIPLALELAAARTRVLTPAQILERLDDCFSLLSRHGRTTLPRHRTIRATIDWSYELLTAQEQLLLRRLSAFAGGFTLEAAEHVCAGGEIQAGHVLDLVAGLVERSLVVMRDDGDSARYSLLEVVRQYAAERLEADGAAGTDAVAARHARFFADFAEASSVGLEVLKDAGTMERVAAEHDNLRMALDRALRAGETHLALRISGSLWPYWLHGAHWSDGFQSMTRVLEREEPAALTAEYGRALLGCGTLAYVLHDLPRALHWMSLAERVWASLSNPRYLALVHASLAQIHMHLGDSTSALRHAELCEERARECGDSWVLAHSLSMARGFVHAFLGEAELADRYCAEAQAVAMREAYPWGILLSSFSRAMTAWMQEDVAATAHHAPRCVAAARHLSYPWFLPRVLLVAAVAMHRADPLRATRLLGACDALQSSSRGGRLLPMELPHHARLVRVLRGILDEPAFAAALDTGARLGPEQALDEAERGLAAAEVPAAASSDTAASSDPAAASSDAVAAFDRTAARPATPAAVSGSGAPRGQGTPAAPALAGDGLSVRALGRLEISRGGELLGTERWSYAKPRELLLYLLCHREGATKEQIGRAIWPDATPAQVRNNLHVTLHYVRKVLGASDWVGYSGERYRVAPDREVDFDVDAFEAEAGAILTDPAAADDVRVRQAIAMYRGDFLASEVPGPWHYEWRDRALSRYVGLLGILAERCLARQEYGEAQRLYQQLITREELREDFHRGLMQCLARTGARMRALQHGEQLARMLRQELDAEPEPETVELCDRLRRAEPV